MTDQALVDLAFSMLERSYVPYSRFPVGAALLCPDGAAFTGCNVENAAYGSCICAERTALVKAVSEGHRDDFVRLAVAGRGEDYCWPYGSCICAERTALVKAVSEGRRQFAALAVAGRGGDYCWPCGACRQMLYEFAPDLTVLVARGDGAYVKTTLRELLPHGFGPASLK